MSDLTMHDRLCEGANTSAHRLSCRCADRHRVRSLFLECGTAAAMTSEAQEHAAINVGMMLEDVMRTMTASLLGRVREAGRIPVLSTLHLVGEHDAFLEGDTLRFVVATVPEGVSPSSSSVLEVADEWMRARGLRG